MSSGCRLPSPAWAMLAISTSCRSADLLDPLEHGRHRADRDADVLGEHRAQPLQRGVGQPAGGEQRVGLVGVVRPRRPGGAGRLEGGQHGVGLGLAGGAGGVDAGEQDRLGVGLQTRGSSSR